jgi:hypothetical protein
VGCFRYGRPSAAVPPGQISRASGPLPFPTPPSLIDGARLSFLSSPKSPTSAHPCGDTDQIVGDGPATHHHPSVTRMPTCALAALSRHVGCGAPWRPIAVGRCIVAAHHYSTRDADAKSSTMKPRAACSAGLTNTAESAPSSPRHSPAGACV